MEMNDPIKDLVLYSHHSADLTTLKRPIRTSDQDPGLLIQRFYAVTLYVKPREIA